MAAEALARQLVLEVAAAMTILTIDARVNSLQGEPRLLLVIELRGLPTGRRVTGAALRAPFRVVHVIRRMAGDALSGCALVPIAEVTGVAGNVAVLVVKRECRFVVIELRVAPCGHVVTGGAVASEPTFVRLFFPVAVHALRGCLAVRF